MCEAASSPSEAGPRSFHPKLSLQPGMGAAPVPVLQLKVKWMRVEKNPGPVFVLLW